MSDPIEIYNWRRLDARVTTSGQPTEAQLAEGCCGIEDEQARALMDSVWRPGGVWAAFIGDEASVSLDHGPPK